MKPLIENQMVVDRPECITHPFDRPIEWVPDPVCQCGCNKTIHVIELRTHDGEPVYSEECFIRIAYKEGWIIKEAV